MRRYEAIASVYRDPDALSEDDSGAEQQYRLSTRAESEEQARRRMVELAHLNGFCISRFLRIESKELTF